MPVHDAMYTHSIASRLQKVVVDPEHDLYEQLEAIKKRALDASTESANAARMMFDVLDQAKMSSNPYIREAAEKILASPYLQEIA